MTPEIWLGTFPVPRRSDTIARMLEANGWDGLAFTDSQNLTGDPFVGLGIAARATSRLKLGTGATNPATRHPAVLAAAIGTLQLESGGRAVLGLARGDSALAQLGRPPMPIRDFRAGVEQIQRYLRGQVVDQNGHPSRLEWLAGIDLPKVPVSVAATGPKVIEMGALLAERVTFSLGAEPERLRWAIDLARRARAGAGLDPLALSLGAYVNAVAHPDVVRARQLVRGRLGVYARFSSMHPAALDTLSEQDRPVVERLAAAYELAGHAASSPRHAAALDDDFVDRFGVVGPSEHVAQRLHELVDLGLDHFVIAGHARDVELETLRESVERFGNEVIPVLKAKKR